MSCRTPRGARDRRVARRAVRGIGELSPCLCSHPLQDGKQHFLASELDCVSRSVRDLVCKKDTSGADSDSFHCNRLKPDL